MSPPFAYHAQAQSTFQPPLVANENAFLGDLVSRFVSAIYHITLYMYNYFSNQKLGVSEPDNPEKPISCGFFRLDKGTPLVYEYGYDEMKIILEGDFAITDETGQSVKASPGDVFYFPKGSKITFTTENGGRAFWVSFLSTEYSVSLGFYPRTDFGRPDNGDMREQYENKLCAHSQRTLDRH